MRLNRKRKRAPETNRRADVQVGGLFIYIYIMDHIVIRAVTYTDKVSATEQVKDKLNPHLKLLLNETQCQHQICEHRD